MSSAKKNGCVWLILLALGRSVCPAGDTNQLPSTVTIDLATPAVMTGTLYEIGSNRQKVLYQFRRSAVRTGEVIRVEQVFSLPDGAVACRENIEYRNDRLMLYAMEDLRADVRGGIRVQTDSTPQKRERVFLDQIQGYDGVAKTLKGVENFQTNMLICDMIYPFILAHWEELMRNAAVKFRLLSLDPPTTYGFKVVKEREATWQGQPVVIIKMELGNLFIAHLIRPIYFTIEKSAPHRVFSYTGRITPRDRTGGAWRFVDAEMVLDWK